MLHTLLAILSIGGYGCLILGIMFILIASITYKRKGEAEVSQSLIELPLFRLGAALVIIGLILKLLF